MFWVEVGHGSINVNTLLWTSQISTRFGPEIQHNFGCWWEVIILFHHFIKEKRSQFEMAHLTQITANFNAVFCCFFCFFVKMLIFMSYLWVNKENEHFFNGKWTQIHKFCIFGRYTQFIYFHQILMHFSPLNWLWQGLQVVFQWISFVSYGLS